jgi:hypothetical protein
VTNPEDLRRISAELLASGCANETEKFLRHLISDTRYCFELFRRAYSELLDDALSYIYNIYLPLLAHRARRHPLYFQSCQNDDYFARVALVNFYKANRGAHFEEKFVALESIIKYLYACLHSAIAQDVRENAQFVASSDDEVGGAQAEGTFTDSVDAVDLWKHIFSLLPELEHQRLAYLRFVLGMKPAEIVKSDPQRWGSERDVSVMLQLIRRRLRKDNWLRGQAGLDENFHEDD